MSSLDIKNICKSDNEFSFLSVVTDLVGNRSFGTGAYDALLCSDILQNRTADTDIWFTLSAIGQDLGGIFQQNINNFIDNLLNIDVCTVKGLQSLAKIIGTDYNIFNTVKNFPIDVLKLIDIFSIKKEYLVNSDVVNKLMAEQIQSQASSYSYENNCCAVLSINNARKDISATYSSDWITYTDISSQWHSENAISSSQLELSAVDQLISATIYNLLSTKTSMTYNDSLSTKIYEDLSDAILNDNFNIPVNATDAEQIDLLIKHYNIDNTFNVYIEADNIDNGITNIDDYTYGQKQVLDIELQRRKAPYSTVELSTRYAYYKQLEVKNYFDFIRNYYLQFDQTYISAEQYAIDNSLFVLNTQYNENKTLLCSDCTLNVQWLTTVSKDLTLAIQSIREIREQLKIFCQKNFMKGTFLLISYVINEYLKSNTLQSLKKLYELNSGYFNSGVDQDKIKFDSNNNYSYLIEYVDPVNYFNISAKYDTLNEYDDSIYNTGTNQRYWEVNSTVSAIGAIDTTNIFAVPPTVQANVFAFDIQTLSAFYFDIMNINFKKYQMRSLSGMSDIDHLTKFLHEVFDFGADKMTKNDDGSINTYLEDTASALIPYKEDLYNQYTADKDGNLPYYYYSNLKHPSYQIHPYLSSFMEKVDYSYPIENIASIVQEDVISLVKNNIADYIDLDGYLINMWKNPLGANQDYLSHYEKSDNIDDKNSLNPVVGYDGLFYPDAINYFKDNSKFTVMLDLLSSGEEYNATKTVKNFYYGLSLTDNEKAKIKQQLELFKDYLSALAFDKDTVIYKYGLDIYGNAYILVKDHVADDTYNTIKAKNGVLFVRQKNHPIALPAFVVKDKVDNKYDLLSCSFFTASNIVNTPNNCAIFNPDDETTALEPIDVFNALKFKDFYISIDKQDIAIVNNTNDVLLASVTKNYDAKQQINSFSLDKVSGSNIEFLYHMKSDKKPFDFGCFTSINNKITVIMFDHTTDPKKVTLEGSMYDYDSNELIIGFNQLDVNISDVKTSTNICLDANNDMLTLAYISNSSLTNIQNYLSVGYNYNNGTYGQFLTRRFTNNIAAKFFNIGRRQFSEIQIEDNSAERGKSYYNTYTDCGFFGLYDKEATTSNSLDPYVNTLQTTYLINELENRGILKFQLLGDAKSGNMIDFKFCLPVRVRESYTKKDKLVSYEYAHFDETVVSAKQGQSIAEETDSEYDPLTVSKVLNGNSAGLMLDEEYFHKLAANEDLPEILNRLYNTTQTAPYLYQGELPDKYLNPGSSSSSSAGADTFLFQLHKTTLSCSWQKNNDGKIELDFNTALYNKLPDGINNYFNEKLCFLHLKNGEAGYLNTYTNHTTLSEQDYTYYIKNISDNHPKFILAAKSTTETETYWLQYTHTASGILVAENLLNTEQDGTKPIDKGNIRIKY